jgi:hypothetical protein
MNVKRTPLQQFLHILKMGHTHAASPETDIQWQQNVMRAVRHIGPLRADTSPLEFMNQFVWRFATVAGMLVLILSVYVAIVGLSPESGVVSQFLDNPVGFLLMQAIGGY